MKDHEGLAAGPEGVEIDPSTTLVGKNQIWEATPDCRTDPDEVEEWQGRTFGRHDRFTPFNCWCGQKVAYSSTVITTMWFAFIFFVASSPLTLSNSSPELRRSARPHTLQP